MPRSRKPRAKDANATGEVIKPMKTVAEEEVSAPAKADISADSGTVAGSDAGAGFGAGASSNTGLLTKARAGGVAETKPETEARTESRTESQTESDAEAEVAETNVHGFVGQMADGHEADGHEGQFGEGGATEWAQHSGFETVAAVDLGSNSFHMLVARWHEGEVITVDRLKETVRLASGLDARNRLTPEAQERALQCLQRFGQRLSNLPPGSVRALGTNTLRKARGSRRFLAAAEEALGHPVEIIGGREEARLIYLGVAHSLSDDRGTRLVVDIGGGSTEFIIGERFEPVLAESMQMGCVTFSSLHFPDGRITLPRFRQAELHAQLEFQPIVKAYRAQGWQQALGSSGTLLAVDRILHETGLEKLPGFSLAGLEALRARMVELGHIDKLTLPGLSADRQPVIVGGLAIIIGIFRGLGIERMMTSEGAMREGVVHDLFGRFHHEDVRGRTINNLRKRFSVDAAHAERVINEAKRLFDPVAKTWALGAEEADLLGWAAELHEIGLALSHSQYHKHGEYILTHADLSGFSRQEQSDLALLVRLHRRRLQEKHLEDVPKARRKRMLRLAILLRLAVLLHRSRSDEAVPLVKISAGRNRISLNFDTGWLESHALTATDLELETQQLANVGYMLKAT